MAVIFLWCKQQTTVREVTYLGHTNLCVYSVLQGK